jgi:hypothetical protein
MTYTHDQTDEKSALLTLLLQSLNELAAAHRADTACQLAGHACAALRLHDPKGWQKFNALLHRRTQTSGPVPAQTREERSSQEQAITLLVDV